MILQRVQIDLIGPDDLPEEESETWTRDERLAKFLFRDHMRIVVQQLRNELPDEFEIDSNII